MIYYFCIVRGDDDMDNKKRKNPFDQKPKDLSDYILDDPEIEEEVVEDISFNTKDNEEISTEDIKICTDRDGASSMKSDVDSDISDVYNLSTGINNTLPKEEIEVLSLSEDKISKSNLSNVNIPNDDRRVKNSKSSANKLVIILVALGALLTMWYTTFAQPLAYNAKQMKLQSNNGSWDIRFTDMYQKRKIGEAKEISNPSYSSTKASFYISLSNPGDEITYNLTIKNAGTLNAKVLSIYIMPENRDDDPILYYVSGIAVGDELNAGESTNMTVTAKYNENINSSNILKNVSVIVNYVQK